jgi:hypothetical protein
MLWSTIWREVFMSKRGEMENWKRAVLACAAGTSVVLFLKGNRPAGVLAAGVGLAVLASEYPEKFEKIREDIPYYVDRGTKFLDAVLRVGNRFTELADTRGRGFLDELLSY